MQFRITEADDGSTVRAFLAAHADFSSKMLKFLKYRNDGILVDGRRVTVRHVLRAGETLAISVADRVDQPALEAVELPLPVLYEDDDVAVPDKPPFMPTHPSHDHYRDTVANALAYRYRSLGIPFVFRPVNRLDRDTSGVLLIARNKPAAGRLTAAMQNGLIRKTYLAVLEGDALPDEGFIDRPLRRSAESIIIRQTCRPDDAGAEPAYTRYRILARGNGCSLAEAQPLTGRTHQLRVHFASLGHPVAGDSLYGIPNGRAPRQMLHARSVVFPHPTTGETVAVTAPIPADMSALLSGLFPLFNPDSEPERSQT